MPGRGPLPLRHLSHPLFLVSGIPEIPGLPVDLRRLLRVADHPHPLRQLMVRQKLHNGPQRHGGRQSHRIAVHPRGNGAEVQGPDTVGLCQKQAAAVAGGQQRRLSLSAPLPDGARRVDDIFGPQAVSCRQLGLSGLTAAQGPALRQQLRPRRRVDGAVHTGASQQRCIGRVDDGLRVRPGEIAHQN